MRLFTLMLLAPAIARAQTTGAGAGRGFCADTRTPCRFATVTIQTAPPRRDGSGPQLKDRPSHSYAATDLDGAYRIADVAPGQYCIMGELAGYVSHSDLAANVGEGDPAPFILHETLTAPLQVEADLAGLTYALTLAKGKAASPIR